MQQIGVFVRACVRVCVCVRVFVCVLTCVHVYLHVYSACVCLCIYTLCFCEHCSVCEQSVVGEKHWFRWYRPYNDLEILCCVLRLCCNIVLPMHTNSSKIAHFVTGYPLSQV